MDLLTTQPSTCARNRCFSSGSYCPARHLHRARQAVASARGAPKRVWYMRETLRIRSTRGLGHTAMKLMAMDIAHFTSTFGSPRVCGCILSAHASGMACARASSSTVAECCPGAVLGWVPVEGSGVPGHCSGSRCWAAADAGIDRKCPAVLQAPGPEAEDLPHSSFASVCLCEDLGEWGPAG